MKKLLKISSASGKEIYQDPNEAKKHFLTQGQDFRRYANNILDFLPVKSGRLLDVGCGFGWVVSEAKRRGFYATGIDEAKPYVQLGKKHLKVDLIVSSLERYNSKEIFDVIILNHVLEHIKNPKPFLNIIYKLLNSNGYFFVACPNIMSLMHWIFKDRWYGLQLNQHVWQFTAISLQNAVKNSGFVIDKVCINSLNYDPPGWKKYLFLILTSFANLAGIGDQVYIVAHRS